MKGPNKCEEGSKGGREERIENDERGMKVEA